MATPYSSSTNLPQGLTTVTINSVAYKLDAISVPSFVNRKIERPDELGDRADFMLRDDSDHIEGSLTLQRANTATVLPPNATNFSLDFDRSGTNSTFVVHGTTVTRSKDAFDVFEVPVVMQSYQS